MSEYPYQLVCFLEKKPALGETVYSGKNGWFAQIALKRRFRYVGIGEDTGLNYVEEFCRHVEGELIFSSGALTSDNHMPVKYIQINDHQSTILTFHNSFLEFMGDRIKSKFPDREGTNYMPHITAEYDGKMVIDADQFTGKDYVIKRICVVKDAEGDNSVAYRYINLGEAYE